MAKCKALTGLTVKGLRKFKKKRLSSRSAIKYSHLPNLKPTNSRLTNY